MQRIKELDSLRAFAILGVLVAHMRPRLIAPFDALAVLGWAGVDLFFVISGFLITGILLGLRQHPTPFREFYWRRTLRIFPPYYLVLLLILALAALHGEGILRRQFVFASLFLTSVTRMFPLHLMASRLMLGDSFEITPVTVNRHYFTLFQGGLWVFWSLSVEEIFYLLWAPIVLRGSKRLILLCSLAPLIACPAIRVLALTSSNFATIAGSFVSRFDALAVGSCLALLFLAVNRRKLPARVLEHGLAFAMPFAFIALIFLSWRCGLLRNIDLRSTLGFNLFGYSLLAIVCASLVAISVQFSGFKITRIFRARALVYVGSISYVVYLIHIPVYVAVGIGLARLEPIPSHAVVQGVLAFGLSIGLAALSWRYIETPILGLRDRTFWRVCRNQILTGKATSANTAA